jgi:precorrin-2/cobalt-factor-2 C20-methyltransferase
MNTGQKLNTNISPAPGALIGVGLGPGDPELVTIKAARLIRTTNVIAYFAKAGRGSNARAIAATYFPSDYEEIPLLYPVTTEIPVADPAYNGFLTPFYAECAERLAQILEQGRNIALLCEGDPMLYGSFMHIYDRLSPRFHVEVCAGVAGMSGCFAAARQPMTWGDDTLTVMPATLDEESLVKRLSVADAAVIMKLGGNFPKLRRALARTGLTERAIYVERGTMAGEKILRLTEKTDDIAPYFSMVLAPGQGRRP